MNLLFGPSILIALACVLGALFAFGWWTRRRLARMQRDLAWSEQSRFAIEEQAQEAQAQLRRANEALRTQRQALERAQAARLRRDKLEADLDRRAVESATIVRAWADTQPMPPAGAPRTPTAPRR